MKKILFVAAFAMALSAGAATAKTYQAYAGKAGGYQSQQTEPNRYVISYTGAKGMKKNEVARFAMLRAAELAIETGNEWFAVISTSTRQVDSNSVSSAMGGGAIIGTEAVVAGQGGDTGGGPKANGIGDATVGGTGTFGGFGGSDVPYQAMEKWRPTKVQQTMMIIQVGSGDGASFPGVVSQPEIFDAKTTVDDIRADIK